MKKWFSVLKLININLVYSDKNTAKQAIYSSRKVSILSWKKKPLITWDSSDAEGCSLKLPEFFFRVRLLLFLTFPFVSPNCSGALLKHSTKSLPSTYRWSAVACSSFRQYGFKEKVSKHTETAANLPRQNKTKQVPLYSKSTHCY